MYAVIRGRIGGAIAVIPGPVEIIVIVIGDLDAGRVIDIQPASEVHIYIGCTLQGTVAGNDLTVGIQVDRPAVGLEICCITEVYPGVGGVVCTTVILIPGFIIEPEDGIGHRDRSICQDGAVTGSCDRGSGKGDGAGLQIYLNILYRDGIIGEGRALDDKGLGKDDIAAAEGTITAGLLGVYCERCAGSDRDRTAPAIIVAFQGRPGSGCIDGLCEAACVET